MTFTMSKNDSTSPFLQKLRANMEENKQQGTSYKIVKGGAPEPVIKYINSEAISREITDFDISEVTGNPLLLQSSLR